MKLGYVRITGTKGLESQFESLLRSGVKQVLADVDGHFLLEVLDSKSCVFIKGAHISSNPVELMEYLIEARSRGVELKFLCKTSADAWAELCRSRPGTIAQAGQLLTEANASKLFSGKSKRVTKRV